MDSMAVIWLFDTHYRIYLNKCPACLLNFWILRGGVYSRLGAYSIFTIFDKYSKKISSYYVLSRLNGISGGNEKIIPVSESF